jgi:hypothetical protein
MRMYYWIYIAATWVQTWAADRQWEYDKRKLGIKED